MSLEIARYLHGVLGNPPNRGARRVYKLFNLSNTRYEHKYFIRSTVLVPL